MFPNKKETETGALFWRGYVSERCLKHIVLPCYKMSNGTTVEVQIKTLPLSESTLKFKKINTEMERNIFPLTPAWRRVRIPPPEA
jgi:hypothetical protein